MTIKIAINGYGRIGRNVLRALFENFNNSEIKVVAINDLADLNTCVHLTKYDTAHGKFHAEISNSDNELIVNGNNIKMFSERNPLDLPWRSLDIDIVLECTGKFRSKELASKHIEAGAKKVLLSAPGIGEVDATLVYGVNEQVLKSTDTIISNASCTTNCLAPIVKPLNDKLGIVSGLMTSVHAYTNDQVLSDTAHKDLRRARSATMSIIPTSTGAAKAVGLVMPELDGKLDGIAMRVPTINVSIVDLVFQTPRSTTVEEVNEIMLNASKGMHGVLQYNQEPLVSIDFNHNPHSSVFDASLTNVINGNMVKVFSWYDNEWGYANRMLDIVKVIMAV